MLLFTIDMDVNRPVAATKIYEMEGIRFCGVSPNQILADKLSVISGKNVFRRIKDVVDLYYLSKVFPFNGVEVKLALKNSDRVLGNF